jgi:hypothetical protein
MQRRSFLAGLVALPIFGITTKFTNYPVNLTEPIEPVFTKVVMNYGEVTIGDLTFSYKWEPYVMPCHGRIPERFITKYVDIHNIRTPGFYNTVPLKHETHDKDHFVRAVTREHRGLPTEFYEIWDGEHNNLWAVISHTSRKTKEYLSKEADTFIRGEA